MGSNTKIEYGYYNNIDGIYIFKFFPESEECNALYVHSHHTNCTVNLIYYNDTINSPSDFFCIPDSYLHLIYNKNEIKKLQGILIYKSLNDLLVDNLLEIL